MFTRSTPYENSPPLRENIVTVGTPGITAPRSQLARYAGTDGLYVRHNERGWKKILAEKVKKSKKGKRAEDANDDNNDSSGGVAAHGSDISVSLRYGSTGQRHNTPEGEESAMGAKGVQTTVTNTNGYDVDEPPILYYSSCSVAPRLLHNINASCEMEEQEYTGWLSWNPLHWVLAAKEIATSLLFRTGPLRKAYSYAHLTNLAGYFDQAQCVRSIERAVRDIEREELATGKKKHLVLFGCSRGATTTFYTAMKLPKVLADRVSLVIVEAPFDTVENVIQKSSWFPKLTLWFFKTFCLYSGKEAYTYDPSQVHLKCPIAFVMTKKDTRVPNECTWNVVNDVKKNCPHLQVETLVLEHSRHPCMAISYKEDQDRYVEFLEGLYTKHCPESPSPFPVHGTQTNPVDSREPQLAVM